MEKIDRCPVCSSSDLLPYQSIPDYFLSRETFEVQQCSACHFLLTNPRPTEPEASRYYQSEAYISHSDTSKGIISRLYKSVRHYALRQKVKLVQKYADTGTALDIGCGTGHFLSLLSQSGFKGRGVEPGDDARAYAREQFKLPVEKSIFDLDDGPEQFDAITLWHVLEHVYTLHDHLDRIKKILKKTGVLIVAVPNPESYDAVHYKKYWAAWDTPRHLYHFTPQSIQKLLKRYGFSLAEIIPMKFDSYYVSLLSEKYQNNHNRYVHALYHGFRSNLKAKSGGKNYSSLIYVFQPKIS